MAQPQPAKEFSEARPEKVAYTAKLEVIVIPVSDVDRAKEFYGRLGWRLDADYAHDDDFRVIQFTPPGSGCSVIFGKNVEKPVDQDADFIPSRRKATQQPR